MKILVIFIVTVTLSLFAETPANQGRLTAKVVLQSGEGYFALDDGSFWKAIPLKKRWRSLSEWWNSVEIIVPKNYECVPNDWFIGAEIEIFPKLDTVTADEENASNQHELKKCTHLLINPNNRQVLFGIPLDPAQCLMQVAQEMRQEGYNEGAAKAQTSSIETQRSACNQAHSQGHSQGYEAGFRDGYLLAAKECEPGRNR